MLERGLLPDFSATAIAEVNALRASQPHPDDGDRDGIRDLRDCSGARSTTTTRATSTSSRSPRTLAGGGVKCWSRSPTSTRSSSGLADRRARAHQHDLGLHGRPDLPDAARAALDRPHVARRGRGPARRRGRDDGRPATASSTASTSTARSCATTPSSPTTASPPGSKGQAPPPTTVAAVPGLDEQLRLQDRVAQALRARAPRARRARPRDDRGPARCSTATSSRDLRADEKNRAKELIEDFMIAANGVTRALPRERRASRRCAAWCARPSAGTAIVSARRASVGETLPAEPDAQALEDVPARGAAQADPAALPRPLAGGRQAARAGRVRRSSCPGSRATGHFGLAVHDYTHSTAPNRRYPDLITQRLLKAALAGGASPYAIDELDALAAHCTEQEDAADKVERQVRKSAAALLLLGRASASVRRASSPAPRRRAPGCASPRPPVEGRLVRGVEGLDVGDRVRVRAASAPTSSAASSTSRVDR